MNANPILTPAQVLAHKGGGGGKKAKKEPRRWFAAYAVTRVGDTLIATVPMHTPNPTNGSHGHWWSKSKTKAHQRYIIGSWLGVLRPLPTPPLVVTLTRLSPGTLDDDNLRPALKSVRDGVADALGLPDDRDPRVEWRYGQRTQKEWGVEVRLERAQ
jgi:hypothetical protein